MNEYKWLNYKQKVLRVLILIDRNIFTGKDGINIDEDSKAAIQLEVIEEEYLKEEEKEKVRKRLSIGIIAGIAVGALIIVAVIAIIIIVAIFISKKKKAKKVVRSTDPYMRAHNLPMEIKYPQNNHSLDIVNKGMESNNW
ncbi:MAG: hypothetical protein EZS28_027586 [Streblomastix strix]|uniref:Uncharacterized protein n=1 Tax=Streblomastix strix TaxID=222440 RepID=A0A5J4V1T1_9EUKA|nr:MAG: hypothetical protein EZS28_027586 [Streblomastix strix]